tara:strand:- start:65598 stop:65852 length:255 start_codon:yes stop_codon:yes gene_type:complete
MMTPELTTRLESALDKIDELNVQHDQYINGGDTEYMTTALGVDVPTLAHQAKMAQDANLDLNELINDTADHFDQQAQDPNGGNE